MINLFAKIIVTGLVGLTGLFAGLWLQAKSDLKRPVSINVTNVDKIKNGKDFNFENVQETIKEVIKLDSTGNPMRKPKLFKRIFKRKN